jgi:Fe-S cluster biogenesis protein NfuA
MERCELVERRVKRVVKVKLQGMLGCPMSTMTLKMGIEKILNRISQRS